MNAQGELRPVILCIDHKDAETQLELFQRVLETAGYAVLPATSASKALDLFQYKKVDLVLTEHIALNVAGVPTLAATLKGLNPDVPVAIYSADLAASPEDMSAADAFISKLVSVDELLATIKKLLVKGEAKIAS